MDKKLLKNICKYSDSEYLQKNIRFFELLSSSNKPSIVPEKYTYFDKCTHTDCYTRQQLKLLGKLYCLMSD